MKKIRKDFNLVPVCFKDFGKVFASAVIMLLVAYLVLTPITHILSSVYIGFFVTMLMAFFAYCLALILFGAVKKGELTHFHG